jgi:hypothetical protein
MRQRGGQYVAVLDGHGRTLRQEWQHRMRCIAQQRHVPLGPLRHGVAVEQAPLECLRRCRRARRGRGCSGAIPGRPPAVLRECWVRSRIRPPIRALVDGHDVHRGAALDVVRHDMRLGAHPERCVRTHETQWVLVHRHQGAPAHVAGVAAAVLPHSASRTAEWMPSAPTIRSASKVLPSEKLALPLARRLYAGALHVEAHPVGGKSPHRIACRSARCT